MNVVMPLIVLLIAAAPALAQPRPKPSVAPEPPAKTEAPRPPEPMGQPVNIRFDITIIDEGGPQSSRKSISVTVADRQSGLVRAAVMVPGLGEVPVSVDVLPMMREGKIRTRMTLDYRPNPASDPKNPSPTPASMRLSFGVLLENGKKIVAAQAADPVTDRRVSVEVTATVLK